MRILVVEDDLKIAEHLKKGLSEASYNVETISDGELALQLVLAEKFDLLVVDVMLPGRDGFSLIKEVRRHGIDVPALYLTAKHSTEDRIEGLQSGGDDYIGKPFSFSELLLRIQAILKRSSKQSDSRRLQFKDLTMDLQSRTVTRAGVKVELHQKEFSLLEYFIRNEGRVLTKTQILEGVWSYDFDPQTNVVDVLVCRLRNKIDRDFSEKIIQTIRGVGYVLRTN